MADTVQIVTNGTAATTDQVPSNFVHVAIALTILFVSTRLVKAGTSHIFALLAAYLIIRNLRQQEQESLSTFNQEMDYRLDMLGTPSHFYRDTDIINLFYNIYGWRSRNENNFALAVKAVNNVLVIEADSEKPLYRCVDNYEVAYDQAKIALNMIHGFVYVISEPLVVAKLKKVLGRLKQLLERHLSNIRRNCEKLESEKPSIDVNSRFVEDAYGPKPYDEAVDTQFDYY